MTRRRTRPDRPRRTADRRLGIGPAWRPVLIAALAAGLLGCWASTAAADDPIVTAVIVKPGAASPTTVGPVSLSKLLETPACVPYSNTTSTLTTVGPTTSSPVTASSDTWTLYTILSCGLGQTLGAGDWVAVQNPFLGPETPLFYAADDLTTPSDFQDPTQVPLIIAEPGENVLQYYRPQRPPDGGVTDENADDAFQVPAGPITIWVDEGGTAPLSVSITGVPAAGVATGATVSLTAGLSAHGGEPPDSADISYTWASNNGVQFTGEGATQTVAATLPAAGSTVVTVEAQDDQDGALGFASATINVGASGPDSASGTPNSSTGQTSQPAAPATGPRQGSGTAAGGTAGTTRHHHSAPPSGGGGASHGRTTATAKPAPAAKHEPAASSETTAPGSAGARPNSSEQQPSPRGALSGPDGARTGAPRAGLPNASPAAAHATTPHTTSASRPTTARKQAQVTGRLIAGVTLLPRGASPLVYAVAPTTATAAAVRRGVGTSALPGLAGGLVVILLFSLGVGRELRWQRRRGARLHGG